MKMEDFLNVTKVTTTSVVTSTDIQPIFFSQRVVNISNGLPRAVDSASSVNNFKNLLADCAEWGM